VGRTEDISEHLTDEQLIEKFRLSHDTIYIGELYYRYAHLILGVGIKYFKNETDASDAVSNIFEILIKELKKHKVDNFRSWLYTVAKNHCLQELRKKQNSYKQTSPFEDFLHETMESEENLHLIEEREVLYLKLEKAMPELKYNQRICIKMFYLEKKTYADIALETGFSLKEIKSYIQNGKRNLLLKLQEENGK
jgi:RNA polymerase sigma factor (sigma-70 family)